MKRRQSRVTPSSPARIAQGTFQVRFSTTLDPLGVFFWPFAAIRRSFSEGRIFNFLSFPRRRESIQKDLDPRVRPGGRPEDDNYVCRALLITSPLNPFPARLRICFSISFLPCFRSLPMNRPATGSSPSLVKNTARDP